MGRPVPLFCAVLFLLCAMAAAETLYVAPGGSSGTCNSPGSPCPSISAALSASGTVTEIVLAAGHYSAAGNIDLHITGFRDISIQGAGQGLTVIDLNAEGRFMTVDDHATVTVSHLTVMNGSAPQEDSIYQGGCFMVTNFATFTADFIDAIGCRVQSRDPNCIGGTILGIDSTIFLNNSLILGSRAGVAGAGYFKGVANVTITNVTFHDAQCTVQGCWGGALVPDGKSQVDIVDSAFIDCVAPQGFGGAIDDGTVAVWSARNTLFLRNRATYGGAVYTYGQTTSYFYNCTFRDNVAENNGGGIKPTSQTLVYIYDSLFEGNIAASNGGVGPAADCSGRAEYCTTIINSEFRNNRAGSVAGALAVASPTYLENVIFDSNWTPDSAGALYLYLDYAMYLNNLTFINNTAPSGAAILLEGFLSVEMHGTTTFINNSARNNLLKGDPTGIGAALLSQGVTSISFNGPVTFEGGSAANGAGIYAVGSSVVTFNDTATFSKNYAVNNGGGIFASSSASIEFNHGVTFQNNEAGVYGGGAYQDVFATISAPNAKLVNNRARFGGGFATGIASQNCPILTQSNFTNNIASLIGSSIYVGSTSIVCECENCIIQGRAGDTQITTAPFSVQPLNNIPTSVTASEAFSASFIVADAYGAQTSAQDRVVNVAITSFELPPGYTSTGSKREAAQVVLRGPSVAYFAANTASFGILKLSGPPGSKATITFSTSPAVVNDYVITIEISKCPNTHVEYETDGTFYCLKANRVSRGAKIGVTVAGGVCIFIGLLTLIWLIQKRNKAAIRKASVLFCILTTVGAILMFVSAIFWVYVSNASCVLRVWFLVIGFVLCYGSIFVKEYRLWLIFDETDLVRTVRVTDGLLLKVVFGGLLVEVLICVTWFIVTPFLKHVQVDLTEETISYRCTSTITPAFFWIMFALNMCILLIGCILSWLARNVPANFNEAKQILFAIYNVTLISIIVVVLGNVFRSNSNAISLCVAIGLLFSSLVTLFILFLPKVRLVADRDAVKRAIQTDIKKLERDIQWKKRMLQEISAESSGSSKGRTMDSSVKPS